jgi:hypothetical protein
MQPYNAEQNKEVEEMSGDFYVFRCPGCGKWAVKEIRTSILTATFKCKYQDCRKTAKIKLDKLYGLALLYKGPYKNPNDASKVCQALSDERKQ